jgi:hypothetical protein
MSAVNVDMIELEGVSKLSLASSVIMGVEQVF